MATQLVANGFDLSVYHAAPSTASGENYEASPLALRSSANLQLHRFAPVLPGRLPGHYVREARELSEHFLRRYLAYPSSDLIYAKGLMADAFLKARARDKLALPPIITNIHGYESFQQPATMMERLRSAILKPAFRSVIQQSDYVVSYGGRITELLHTKLDVPSSRILEFSGAVDERFLSDVTPSVVSRPRRFAFVGRYERRKGLEELAQVLQRQHGTDFEFHVVGPIPERVQRLFPPNVTFHGSVSDRDALVSLLDSFDVLVCPSWSEGMPNVIMEAMARNTAVIATDVGATSLLVDSANGELIPARNSHALHEAIYRMTQNGDERLAAMKSASNLRIRKRFTWSTLSPALAQRLSGLASKGQAVRRGA